MKNLQILYLALLLSSSCIAQINIPTNTKEILTSKNWIIDGLETDIYKIVFTNTKLTMYSNGTSIGEMDYYLSNDISNCSTNGFIQINVGNTSIGKYIITLKSCYELLSINNDKLIFKNLKDNSITTASPE